jgi:hypothetical protein
MKQRERWLGLSALLGDAVEHATTAIERIHMTTARRPFQIIEAIPPIAAPTKLVHEVHDAIVTTTYRQIRFWNGAVQKVVQTALAEDTPEPGATSHAPEKQER